MSISPTSLRDRPSLAVLSLCLSLAAHSAASAEDQPSPSTTVTPVTVSATRTPTPVDQVASSVTVITAREIELKQERNLPDILRDVPGLNLIQTGGPGGVTSIFLRGTNSNHVKTIIDGIDVSDPTTPTGVFQYQNFLASGIAQVEVLRGPQSGLYGADAIGGVIDVVTKTGSGPLQGQASLEGGSFGTFNQSAAISGSEGRFSYALDWAHLRTDDVAVTPTNLLPAGDPRNDDSYDNETVGGKVGYKLTDDFDLGLVARYIHSDLHFTSDFDVLNGPDPIQSKSLADQFFTRLTAHLALFDDRFDQTLGVGYTYYRRDDLVPESLPSPNDGDRYKIDWQGVFKITPDEVLIAGAEHQRDEIIQSPISAQISNDAGYLELQSSYAGRFFNTLAVRDDDNNRYGDYVTYRIAPSLLFPETGTRLKASIGTGFKAPTLNELFVSFPAFDFFANPNLRPEHDFGYEVGFEQDVTPLKAQFGVTWFHNDITDLINENAAFTMDVNVGRATTEGIEAFVAWRPIEALSARADYTYTQAEDDVLHTPLLRRPKNKVSLDVLWQATPQLSFTAEGLFVGSWIDDNRFFTTPPGPQAGYATLNLTANYEVDKHLTLFGRLTNLANKQYQNPEGFLAPGIGVFAGIKAGF